MHMSQPFRKIITVIFSFCVLGANASENIRNADTLATTPTNGEKGVSGLKGVVRKVIGYFERANEPHPEKRFDISFIGGPFYSSEEGLGLGVVSSGLYYTLRGSDGLPHLSTPPSMVSLKFQISTGQLYKVSGEGFHVFPHNRLRLNYEGYFYSFKDNFWGIGYNAAIRDSNCSIYKRFQALVRADLGVVLSPSLYLGPAARFTYVNATRADRPELFDGQALRTLTTGVGVTLFYDTRDVPVNAYRGVYVRFNQLFNPRFMGNRYAFSESELTAAAYAGVWKGGILATMFHAHFTYGNTPWGLMPTFGGSDRMRGYYEGRFRDKNEMDFTIELRQHVWRRNGIVVWAGVGNVFPRFSAFKWNHLLPNVGIGYRWQFKPRVNIRLDLGFGKNEKGINFSINEAF